jgi:hypothetical protein
MAIVAPNMTAAAPPVQDKNPSPIICRMTTPDGIYVLYKDVPRRRYRRIAAKSEVSPSHLQFFVEITEGEPFDFENSDVQIVPCSTRSEAMAKAEQERESSLNSDWREYPDAPL